MCQDIFEFWDQVPIDATCHPADRNVLKRASHNFRSDCLPLSYFGPLRDAAIVLLFLSPGFDEGDPAHGQSIAGQRYYARQRTGNVALPSEEEHASAWRWWSQRVQQLQIDLETAARQVAVLNIAAYKSAQFNDPHMLAALPSSRVTLDWAQSELFPRAEAGKRVVICLRAHRYWGLGVGQTNSRWVIWP